MLWVQTSRLLWLLLTAALLSACVTTPQPLSGNSTAGSVSELRDWQARGRIGINAAQQSGSGSFAWAQAEEHSAVQLRGPAGFGAVDIDLQATQLRIIGSDGVAYDADAALEQMQVLLGAPLPVAALRFWLLGLAAPGDARWLDAAHSELEQNGWHITYETWTARGMLRLPLRMALQRAEVRMRIVIQQWTLNR